MTALQHLLDSYRQASQTEREKGTYFELPIFATKPPMPIYTVMYGYLAIGQKSTPNSI